jgi:DNA-binding response OmpR family regulator
MKRLIVVEPDAQEAWRLCRELEGPELLVRWVSAVPEALAQMAAEPFDMVFAALRMGPPDGTELVRALRGRGFQVPVILLSDQYARDVGLDIDLMRWGRAAVIPRRVPAHWYQTLPASVLDLPMSA